MDKKYILLGRTLSYILRHNPSHIQLELDESGWADVTDLIKKMKEKGYDITLSLLYEIVNTNDKKRYIFNTNKTKIRANQGHSIPIDLNLEPLTPPFLLYHGTSKKYIEHIELEGLTKQKRHHVHLSEFEDVALTVGKRRGKPIILTIHSEQMHHDGYTFYRSENNVWLTDHVPALYINFNSKK